MSGRRWVYLWLVGALAWAGRGDSAAGGASEAVGTVARVHPTRPFVTVRIEPGVQLQKGARICFGERGRVQRPCGRYVFKKRDLRLVRVKRSVAESIRPGQGAYRIRRKKNKEEDGTSVVGQEDGSITERRGSGEEEGPADQEESQGEHGFGVEAIGQYRFFPKDPLYEDQDSRFGSLALRSHYEYESAGEDWFFRFVPYYRYDPEHDARSLADIREAELLLEGRSAELRLGIRQVFWGVVESQHLVDVINQTDPIADPEEEEKLGQPMVNFEWFGTYGDLEFFILPVFRPMPFPGDSGRFRGRFPIDEENEIYQSPEEENHTDWAARYYLTEGGLDLGLSFFSGTRRDPGFRLESLGGRRRVLVPYYPLMQQTGLETTYTLGGALLKLEAVNRNPPGDAYQAVTGGGEYTFYQVFGSRSNLGVLAEYSWDSRDPQDAGALQNDGFLAGRWALNDFSSTEVLAGIVKDLEFETIGYRVEASRRFGGYVSADLLAQGFPVTDEDDVIHAFREDEFVQLRLTVAY